VYAWADDTICLHDTPAYRHHRTGQAYLGQNALFIFRKFVYKVGEEFSAESVTMYGWFGIYGTTDFPDWCYGKNIIFVS